MEPSRAAERRFDAAPYLARSRAQQRQEAAATSGVILVMLDHPAAANELLAATSCLSNLAGGARIIVLVARVPPASTILPSEQVMTRGREARLRAQESSRTAALKATFDAWSAATATPTGSVKWLDIEAVAHDLIIEWGRRADFIVLERPGDRDYGTTWQALPAALFETDRPVLVVPPGWTKPFGQRVAIAWRDDAHAARAVLSALRCVTGAGGVHLLAGVRPASPTPKVPEILSEHSIAADLHVIPIGEPPFGSALLERAHALGADMLVAGAYAHSPLRELILGGVTRFMIAHADLPVLFRH